MVKVKYVSSLVFLLLVLIVLLAISILRLDLGQETNEKHYEVMLWEKNNGFASNVGFQVRIVPMIDRINVFYDIKNNSGKGFAFYNTSEIRIYNADKGTIGDPGSFIAKISSTKENGLSELVELKPNEVVHRSFLIHKKQIKRLGNQYYISFYFNDQLVEQYKVIEGLEK